MWECGVSLHKIVTFKLVQAAVPATSWTMDVFVFLQQTLKDAGTGRDGELFFAYCVGRYRIDDG